MSKMSHLLFKQNSQQPKQFRGGEKKVMKKSLSLLVAIAMVFSMFASVVSAADAKTAGEKLFDLGVIKGTNEGLDEDKEWLRRDVTVLLSRLYGQEEAAKETANTHGFEDVTDKFYSAYVSWAKNEELFKGKSETTFGPIDNITYGQFATVVLRALGQDQDDEAKNLEKAIELELLPAGTKQTDAAKRGVTYGSIVAALDVKVDGKKLGTKLGLKGYEIVDLEINAASAVVAKTVVVDFNDAVAAINAHDVKVADANGTTVLVEKVTVKDSQATITLATALTSGKEYTVSIAKATGVEANALENGSATFTYTKGVPASVAIASTTVALNKTVGYVVKDANGVDITSDFPVTDFQVSTSNASVVSNNLVAGTIGYSVINLTLNADNKVTTGNVTVNVVNNLSISIKKAEINSNNTVFLGESSATGLVVVDVVDQANAPVSVTGTVYSSSNPAVVVVNQNGTYTAVQAGTATISVTVKTNEGLTATSSFTVTVKAKRVATSFSLDKNAVTVVKDLASNGSYIAQNVTVTVLDQYGNGFAGETVNAAVAANGTTIATVTASATTNNEGKATFAIASAGAAGSTSVQFTVPAISATTTQSVAVNSVAKAQASGYAVVVSTTSLDSARHSDASKAGADKATIGVYVKDVNGNHIDFLASNEYVTEVVGTAGLITTNGSTEVYPVGNKLGTQAVTVKVGSTVIQTITFEVKATSASFASSVVVNKSGVTVSAGSLSAALFGNDGALKAVNPQGEQFALNTAVNATAAVYSNNTAVVSGSNLGDVVAHTTGQAILTIVVNGSVYTVTVNVQ